MNKKYEELQKKIVEMIKEHSSKDSFAESVNKEKIAEIEHELGVELPESYKWFVEQYGKGGIGIEVFGVERNGNHSVTEETLFYRQFNLPKSYVVIEDAGEWVYCLVTDKLQDGECPVVDWDQLGGTGIMKYENFYEYIIESFTDSIENM
ncbi:SMI1/KNR4 family protein [Paludifilum halophilum]|uniref:Knr4/Smi1-like domain-containing protein n=1 Tax=Paludifilum halophilum TaxID=1642702 RepID=A0A235B9U3_9BACL|nr:SMI1/KNR4 family protein [Paludifilum halophilum]OYD09070.1 hypothetical protein CHM34_04710 [Paludifilum halophilum]